MAVERFVNLLLAVTLIEVMDNCRNRIRDLSVSRQSVPVLGLGVGTPMLSACQSKTLNNSKRSLQCISTRSWI